MPDLWDFIQGALAALGVKRVFRVFSVEPTKLSVCETLITRESPGIPIICRTVAIHRFEDGRFDVDVVKAQPRRRKRK